ncbi:MAG: Mannosylglycerate hydrolase [Lentisphaerae bacterium ADurb.Bin242]|nr:MAG: Mannosylglycerate hydrolase [Lentisphaerae bacterium ADurb.Bin242]
MTDKEFLSTIKRARHFCEVTYGRQLSNAHTLQAEYAISGKNTSFQDRRQLKYVPVSVGDTWGNAWDHGWFHLTAEVPRELCGQQLALQLNFNAEGLLFSASGKALSAITCNSIFLENWSKEFILLPAETSHIDLWLETTAAYINGTSLQNTLETGLQNYNDHQAVIRKMQFGIWNLPLHTLRHRIALLTDAGASFGFNHKSVKIMEAVKRALAMYAVKPGMPELAIRELDDIIHARGDSLTVAAYAVGHAHIDLAYLWPVAESIRKAARTFANQLDLLERCPEYIFGISQPQLYQFVKEYYPGIYSRIKHFVQEKRWELQGGMWCESDTNLPGGESLIRQFLYGKNFFMDEFGIEVKNLWLPDVFGCPASLPQIIKKCGCNFFLTQKLSWNDTNVFPYHSFRWRGIDNSEIIAHFPPENNYASMLNPGSLYKAGQRLAEEPCLDSFLSLYGVGDGGGGPTEDHVENGRLLADFPDIPKVRFERADSFLEMLAMNRDNLPVWKDELYLEKHRATLTTQAFIKKENRILENLIVQLEILFAGQLNYPAAQFDKMWKLLLVHQFHDIISGSSIPGVYEDTRRDYSLLRDECNALLKNYAESYLTPNAQSITLYNTLPQFCRYLLPLPKDWSSCKNTLCQKLHDDTVFAQVAIPPNSSLTLHRSDIPPAAGNSSENLLVLENEWMRYEFTADARLVSAFDKEESREVLKSSAASNLFSLYVDWPQSYDAWDIDPDYEGKFIEHQTGILFRRLPDGAVAKCIRFEMSIGKSKIMQTVRLGNDSKRLDFITSVDWNEEHRMLRVAFELDTRSEFASCDIQFGYIRRSTRRNTSWEKVRSEVAAHRYADISDTGYGVALLNDCKYGYKLQESNIELNLLRSPKYPDSSADIEYHEFTYAFFPHKGDLIGSTVMEEAAQLNSPPLVFYGFQGEINPPCHLEDHHGIKLSTMKKAEKSTDLIIRLVEIYGKNSSATLVFPEDMQISECDMIEWHEIKKYPVMKRISLKFKPFEIITLKCHISKSAG